MARLGLETLDGIAEISRVFPRCGIILGLFFYLKFFFFLAVVLLILGANLDQQISEYINISKIPLVLALVLAPLLETSLRQSLLLSFGSPLIFIERPIAAVLTAAVLVALFGPFVARLVRRRRGRTV